MSGYISFLPLDPLQRAVRVDLADRSQMHRTVMSGFGQVPGDAARATLGVLYRLEEGEHPFLLVRSSPEPDYHLPAGYLAGAVETRPVDLSGIATGDRLAFRLVANPVRSVSRTDGEGGFLKNGRRLPLRTPEARIDWLVTRMSAAAELIGTDAVEPPGARSRAHLRNGSWLYCDAVRFDGELLVRDPDELRRLEREGIGKGRAYGMGLLSLRRLPN